MARGTKRIARFPGIGDGASDRQRLVAVAKSIEDLAADEEAALQSVRVRRTKRRARLPGTGDGASDQQRLFAGPSL